MDLEEIPISDDRPIIDHTEFQSSVFPVSLLVDGSYRIPTERAQSPSTSLIGIDNLRKRAVFPSFP